MFFDFGGKHEHIVEQFRLDCSGYPSYYLEGDTFHAYGDEAAPYFGDYAVTIDDEGYITLPIIGKLQCAGLTRMELAHNIENRIREAGYIADPQVNVRFANLTISVVGEVNKPGRYDIERDQLPIFEALALAGDMTIYGSREDVAIIREQNGKNIITKLDLRNPECLSSDCYYLEQNDVIIVSPNKYKAATAEINQNRTFWISITSTAISLATLLLTILL